MPSIENFRAAKLNGFRRVFSLVSISGIKNGATYPHIAALAIRPDPSSFVIGCLFDIPENELEGYLMREARYKAVELEFDLFTATAPAEGTQQVKAFTVIEQTDEDYQARLVQENKSYDEEVRRFYDGQLWGREDILPMPDYLSLCMQAASALDQSENLSSYNSSARENILQMGYLADCTTIESYIANTASRL
jgi:hypothetical protein